jgi:hypothetical protein
MTEDLKTNSLSMGSLVCPHCNKNHPSNDWCRCEGATKYRSEVLEEQLEKLKSKENDTWEFFQDASYYDMFCVRSKDDRQFGTGFHLVNGGEAEKLCDLLNTLTKGQSNG